MGGSPHGYPKIRGGNPFPFYLLLHLSIQGIGNDAQLFFMCFTAHRLMVEDEGPPCQALVVDCNEQMIGDVGSCPKTAPCLLS